MPLKGGPSHEFVLLVSPLRKDSDKGGRGRGGVGEWELISDGVERLFEIRDDD